MVESGFQVELVEEGGCSKRQVDGILSAGVCSRHKAYLKEVNKG